MTKVKPFTEPEDEIDGTYDVRYVLKPMTTTLQIFGLFIPKHRQGFARFLQWIYSLLILSILWINSVRTAIIFQASISLSASIITTAAIFVVYSASAYVSTTFMLVSTRQLDDMLDAFDNYNSRHGFAFKPKRVRKILFCVCVSVPISSLLSTFWTSYVLANYESDLTLLLYPFESTTHLYVSIAITALQTVASGILGTLTIIPFGFFCYSITKEFSTFNKRFQEAASTNIEALRQHHRDICRLLDESNGIVTHIVFTFLAATIPTSCLLLFAMLVGSLPFWDLIIFICLALSYVAIAFALVIAGSILNLKAHGCLDSIMDIKLENLPEKSVHVISVFTTRLTGPPIGFHVYGMFTVDTSTILTIFGSLMTYALVIVQFSPDVSFLDDCSTMTKEFSSLSD